MVGLSKSLERTICLALIQWMGITTTLPVTPTSDAGLPHHESSLAPSLAASPDIFHTRTHPAQPDVFCMYEYLRPESKIPNHSTYFIFATLKVNGPFEMTTTMPSRQNDVMCTMGLHSVERNYDYACMGLDQKDIPQGSALGVLGITVASILVDDFLPSACVLLRIVSSHLGFS